MSWTDLVPRLVCPLDREPLVVAGHEARCPRDHRYQVGEHGYLEVAPRDSPVLTVESTVDEVAAHQETGGPRTYQSYLRSWLHEQGATSVLDVGCGVGTVVAEMQADGLGAIGVDMRGVARYWQEGGRGADGFVVGDAVALPFPDGSFDVVMALGVIEHVGTLTGHLTLAADWRRQRQAFAHELTRVTRPGGRVLIACPNKWFPVDVQHGPTDQLTPAPARQRIFDRLGVNIHPTWGAYHLASYADLWSWYGRDRVRALPLAGYFGFSAFERPGVPEVLGRVARAWVQDLPAVLRSTPLNPYVLAEILV